MELNDFRKDLIQEVKSRAESGRDFIAAAFVAAAGSRLEDANELSDFEICHFRGTGTRQRNIGLDGYTYDESDSSLRVLIGDWRGTKEAPTLTQAEAARLFGQARAFLEDALAGRLKDMEVSTPAFELVSLLEEIEPNISSFRVYLATDAILSSRIKDWPEGSVGGKPVDLHIWDISRFHRTFESASGRDELIVSFTDNDGAGIPIIPASISGNRYQSYMCVLPGAMLASMYNVFGSRLLEGNVRAFLSLRGAVNKGIRETILNEPDMFFAYNNGITAVASEIQIQEKRGARQLVWARDLQIVNGGQTTASLAMAARNDKAELGKVTVQMKLSVIPANQSAEIIPRISRFANSQNKVSDADFFSNHEFHRRMEEISRRIWAPAHGGAQYDTHWFYERARGQYVTELASRLGADRTRFELLSPRAQVVTKTDLAKHENSWLCLPHQVSRGAQKNFVAFAERVTGVWEKRHNDFDDEFFRRSIGRAILFKTLERMIPSEEWYDGGFRAQIVTYSIAKLASMVRNEGSDLDFESVWRRQAISPALLEQLRSISRAVSRVISAPPRGTRNVTEWCKKETCWDAVQKISLALRSGLRVELLKSGR